MIDSYSVDQVIDNLAEFCNELIEAGYDPTKGHFDVETDNEPYTTDEYAVVNYVTPLK